MKAVIGETAGKIWQTLSEREPVPLSRLPRLLGEKDTVVYQALGWLAREDKIMYHTKANRTSISRR
jgi:hypothetical protein